MATPFIKWAGGKRKLIDKIESCLPKDFDKLENITYVEPFVGGGAVLFHLLEKYQNITSAIICDTNKKLIDLYKDVRDNVEELIDTLKSIESEYLQLLDEEKKTYYLDIRDKFNNSSEHTIRMSAYLIFLNKTCYNGLYRVNKKGLFNVSFGNMKNPKICDEDTLKNCNKILQRVTALCCDFDETTTHASSNTLYYLDPPYTPISDTSDFVSYTSDGFDDSDQRRLLGFCDDVTAEDAMFIMSNSFTQDEEWASKYTTIEVSANRSINSNTSKRGAIKEVLIHNIEDDGNYNKPSIYTPGSKEMRWYRRWENNKLFESKPDEREPFTILLPPPNVTGVLHLGHALNVTIQDIEARYARMNGKNVCWVPGADHASIATESKVIKELAEKGLRKNDYSREEFISLTKAWSNSHKATIYGQLKKLGASCDWNRALYTMDKKYSKSINKVFCDLYRKGLIYKATKVVNWDPVANTVVSDEEVTYEDKIDENGNFVKIGYSERTGARIEQRESSQWFLKMGALAEKALEIISSNKIKSNIYLINSPCYRWLKHAKDWCISRQLWWGHRIPVYYLNKGREIWQIAAESKKIALLEFKRVFGFIVTEDDIEQDTDCLDTWFSSWLWPIVAFDGINNPYNDELKYYLPSKTLVTGSDILFFWVARMIMACCEYNTPAPFEFVYVTGLLRDSHNRKLSKSLDNSPDLSKLINKYGADAIRFSLIYGNTDPYDRKLPDDFPKEGIRFCNKLWNIYQFISNQKTESYIQPKHCIEMCKWMSTDIAHTRYCVDDSLSKHRYSDALHKIYSLVVDDFSGTFIDVIKRRDTEFMDECTYRSIIKYFNSILEILHPFLPFITEELSQKINNTSCGDFIETRKWTPLTVIKMENELIDHQLLVQRLIAVLRQFKKEYGSLEGKVLYQTNSLFTSNFRSTILRTTGIKDIITIDKLPTQYPPFSIGTTYFAVSVDPKYNITKKIEELEEKIKHYTKMQKKSSDLLHNSTFLTSAPSDIIERERKKEKDFSEHIQHANVLIDELKTFRDK